MLERETGVGVLCFVFCVLVFIGTVVLYLKGVSKQDKKPRNFLRGVAAHTLHGLDWAHPIVVSSRL